MNTQQRFNNYRFKSGLYANKTIPEVYKINYQHILDIENTSKDQNLLQIIKEYRAFRQEFIDYNKAFKEDTKFTNYVKAILKQTSLARQLSKEIKDIEDINGKVYIKEVLDQLCLEIQETFYKNNYKTQDQNTFENFEKYVEENRDKLTERSHNELRQIIKAFKE